MCDIKLTLCFIDSRREDVWVLEDSPLTVNVEILRIKTMSPFDAHEIGTAIYSYRLQINTNIFQLISNNIER